MTTPAPRVRSRPPLSARDLAPAPKIADRWLDDFEADAWADAAELAAAFEHMSDEELQQVFVRADACRDVKRLTLAGPVMLRRGLMRRPGVVALGRALLSHGRFAEAAETLSLPLAVERVKLGPVLLRIRALAAADRLPEARQVVEDAIALPPHLPLEPLREKLERMKELAAREAELTSSEIVELAQAYLHLNIQARAAPLLAAAMARPETSGHAAADLLALTNLALQADLVDEASSCIEARPHSEANDDGWQAAAIAAAILAGSPGPSVPRRSTPPESTSLKFWRAIQTEMRGDVDGAAAQFCGLAEEFKGDQNVRKALARCVGKSVIAAVRPKFEPGRTGRIVNVMPFFNELDLLRVHLEEMSPWIDQFVIVEGTQSFTGKDKPLVFEANRDLFKDFEAKIVYVPVHSFPAHLTSPWGRDFYQRDMGIAGASGLCGEEDYIVETDLDEIIDQRALEGFEADFAGLELTLSRFFLNYRPAPGNPDRARAKSTIFKAKHRARYGLSYCRFFLAGLYREAHLVTQAGWHFTSMFDASGISLKVNSYAHQETNKPRYRTPEHFGEMLERLRSGRLAPGWERAEIDDSFPAYIRRNREAFADLIL